MGRTYRELAKEYPIRLSRTIAFVQRYVRGFKGTVLDIGCSEGYYLRLVPEPNEKVGLDLSASSLSKAGDIHKVCGSMENLPFRRGTFDMIFCFETVGYALNLKTFIEELTSLLPKDGTCLISTHAEDSMIQRAVLRLIPRKVLRLILRGQGQYPLPSATPPIHGYRRYRFGALARLLQSNHNFSLRQFAPSPKSSRLIRRMIPFADPLILVAGRFVHLDAWMVHEFCAFTVRCSKDYRTSRQYAGKDLIVGSTSASPPVMDEAETTGGPISS